MFPLGKLEILEGLDHSYSKALSISYLLLVIMKDGIVSIRLIWRHEINAVAYLGTRKRLKKTTTLSWWSALSREFRQRTGGEV